MGTPLGDQVISTQLPTGVVYVPASSSPVLVRVNYGDARIMGFEHQFDWSVVPRWSVGTVLTILHAKDTATGLAPNIEGGTPGPDFYLKLRYSAPNGRYWVEPILHVAREQTRLFTPDLEDRRTGATRTRTNIRNFFYNGATVRGWVVPGPDGIAGNADDVLTVMGETLAQVQNRVLGAAVHQGPWVHDRGRSRRVPVRDEARDHVRGREPHRPELPRHRVGLRRSRQQHLGRLHR